MLSMFVFLKYGLYTVVCKVGKKDRYIYIF